MEDHFDVPGAPVPGLDDEERVEDNKGCFGCVILITFIVLLLAISVFMSFCIDA